MATRMQQRRGTAAQWISTNSGQGPVLNAGEIGFESDNNRFKIGDGVNHWVDLPYFANNEAISALIDGAPELLNTLNELAAAMNDDPAFFTTVAADVDQIGGYISDHQSSTIDVHGIPDTSALTTKTYVDAEVDGAKTYADELVGNATVEQSLLAGLGIEWNSQTEQFDVDTTIAREGDLQAHIVDTTNVHGIENTALLATKDYADGAVSTHNADTMDIHGIQDTAELATKEFAASLLVGATKTNISITGDKTGLTIVAENGVSDSTTDDLAEGLTKLYFTEERAQDAIGNSVGTGLEYNDATGAIAVDTSSIQERVAGVSDTEIGHLNGVTSAIQTQLDEKSTDLSTHTALTLNVHGIANTAELETQTGSQAKADLAQGASENYADTAVSAAVATLTKSSVGLANVDNTSDANKPVSTATQTELNAKASLAGAVFTGNVEVDGNLVVDGDFTVNGTNFNASATSITIEDNMLQLSHTNPGNTVDLGLVVAYNDGAAKHAGFVRDVSESKWKLFKDVSTEPTTTVAFAEGSLDSLALNGLEATSATIGNVSNTEIQHLDGVTSAIQTQLNAKQAVVSGVSDTEIGYLDGVTSAIQTQLNAKQAVVSGVSDTEIGYLDGVTSGIQAQIDTKLASIVSVSAQTASYTIALADKDKVIEMNVGSGNTITVPLDSSINFPVGSQIDILQVGSGQTTVVAAGGVTINATPGLKLRTQYAGATLRKRAANTWVLVGDLTA